MDKRNSTTCMFCVIGLEFIGEQRNCFMWVIILNVLWMLPSRNNFLKIRVALESFNWISEAGLGTLKVQNFIKNLLETCICYY